MEPKSKITLRQHFKSFDNLWEASSDLYTTPPTYSLWLKGAKPKIKAHRERILQQGIKKWW